MKVTVEVSELKPGSGPGNLSNRLVFSDERWKTLDVCVHGRRLRWQCVECIEYYEGRAKRKKALLGTVIGLFGLLICFALAKWALHRFRLSDDKHRAFASAHYMRRVLKDYYVGRTNRFPESLSAMVAEGELHENDLGGSHGWTREYTQPSPTAAGTTAIYVVTSPLKHQAVVTKDFRIVVNRVSRP